MAMGNSPKSPGGISVMLGIGAKPKRPGAPPPMPGSSGPMRGSSGPPSSQGPPSPTEEKSEGEMGIPPAAVSYRDEGQRCDGCEYYGSGTCTKLLMPVDPGAGCNLFEQGAGGSDQGQGDVGGGDSGGVQGMGDMTGGMAT